MAIDYSLSDEIDDVVLDLIKRTGFTREPELIRQIATTAFKLVEDGAIRGDLKIVNSALKELRHSFRLFTPFRSYRKISIFGSARLASDTAEYILAEEFAGALVRAGYLVITGAGPGIMEAGNRGAGEGGSFGLGIRLPVEPEANRFIRRQDRLINFKYFFTRKLVFIKESDAVALFPGGFGTMDECFELLTLLQTGKCDPRPVLLMEPAESGFWGNWIDFVREQQAARGLIDPDDLVFLTRVTDPEQAIDEIRSFYSNYNSSRFIGENLLIRLEHPATEGQLVDWNRRFGDITISGGIRRTKLPAEDLEDPLRMQLHGISLRFDRRKTVRLRQLIDCINGRSRD
jgi:uncharacterized protein (TIGR00730 family)